MSVNLSKIRRNRMEPGRLPGRGRITRRSGVSVRIGGNLTGLLNIFVMKNASLTLTKMNR